MEKQPPEVSPGIPLPADLAAKAHLFNQHVAGQEIAYAPQVKKISSALRIEANLEREIVEGSGSRELIRNYLSPATPKDVFELQEIAPRLVDALAGNVKKPDAFDFMMAIRGLTFLADAAVSSWTQATQERQAEHFSDLMAAFSIEFVGRMDRSELIWRDDFDMSELYKMVFPAESAREDDPIPLLQEMILRESYRMEDTLMLYALVGGAQLSSVLAPNAYNKPLSQKQIDAINGNAAETIERIHLLKAYGITPMLVPGETIGLPLDIIIHPPTSHAEEGEVEAYEPGALADFFFVQPDPNRTDILRRTASDPANPKRALATTGGGGIMSRLRLHDNGQISFGSVQHNIPGDHTEKMFTKLQSDPAFVRLRGLMIALACDVVAPEKVTCEKLGGGVAAQFNELQRQPGREPFVDLLLHRQQVLREAGVSPTNRTPIGWDAPKNPVTGFQRRLLPGTRRGPDAEEKARQFYESIGKAFDGLEEGKTFVAPHERRTGLAEDVYRRARFRGTSNVAKFVGPLGVKKKNTKRKRK